MAFGCPTIMAKSNMAAVVHDEHLIFFFIAVGIYACVIPVIQLILVC